MRVHLVVRRRDVQAAVFLFALIVLVAPFGASMIMVATSLDRGGAPGLLMAFTPLWLLDGVVGLVLLCHLGLALGRLCCGPRSAEDLGVFAFALAFFGLILVPPMLTLIFTAMKEEALGFGVRSGGSGGSSGDESGVAGAAAMASMSWKRVLAPLLFWLTIATLVSWAVSLGALFTNCVRPWLQARAQQPDPFGAENGIAIIERGRVVVPNAAGPAAGGGAAA